MRVSTKTVGILGIATAAASSIVGVSGNGLIDTMRHDIFVVTPKNYDSQINLHRANGVATVLYYKDNAESKSFIDGEFNEFAKDVKGMAKVAGIDCDAFSQHCEKEGVTEFPSVYILPPQPFGPQKYQGAKTKASLVSATLQHIPSGHVKSLTYETPDDKLLVDALLTTNVAVPKVMLFSSKKKPPTLFNALSNSFHDRMTFAFITEGETELVKRFGITKFPTLSVLKGELAPGKAGDMYSGEMKFGPLHEWLNVRSETFVKGGGYASEETAEEIKPWLVQKVPEITRASHQDACFRHKVLCVIYMSKSGAPSADTMAMLEKMADFHESTGSDRTAKFKFSWIDSSVETAFAELVGADTQKDTVVIFNPHKRLRFLKLAKEADVSEKAIDALVEKILGGDARFFNVKGQKLPPFAAREEKKADDKKQEEKKEEL